MIINYAVIMIVMIIIMIFMTITMITRIMIMIIMTMIMICMIIMVVEYLAYMRDSQLDQVSIPAGTRLTGEVSDFRLPGNIIVRMIVENHDSWQHHCHRGKS